MKKILLICFSFLLFTVGVTAQTTSATTAAATTEGKPKRVAFRPTKDQITEAQTKLKASDLYNGEATGRYNDDTRAAIKTYQDSNGLAKTGTLNRATLEKMGIELTETQKAIPVSESSFATAEAKEKPNAASADVPAGTEAKPKRGPIFRASKDQIKEAQKMLKTGGMYDGEETGQLNDDTRAGLKKYQEANGLKVTGTLNQVTLEKMGIELTETQKANAAAESNK